MSKYHVVHGSVVVGGADGERKTYSVGDTFDLSDADAVPLLEAGTIAKGSKMKDGEVAPTTPGGVLTPPEVDIDLQREQAAEGAPKASQDPQAAARQVRKELSQK